eukprot:1791566-Rhodomonas_salina.1
MARVRPVRVDGDSCSGAVCTVLRMCYAMPGTRIGDVRACSAVLHARYSDSARPPLCGTERAGGGGRAEREEDQRSEEPRHHGPCLSSAIRLRPVLRYPPTRLRYLPTRCAVLPKRVCAGYGNGLWDARYQQRGCALCYRPRRALRDVRY